jgi:hypothetical protein
VQGLFHPELSMSDFKARLLPYFQLYPAKTRGMDILGLRLIKINVL